VLSKEDESMVEIVVKIKQNSQKFNSKGRILSRFTQGQPENNLYWETSYVVRVAEDASNENV